MKPVENPGIEFMNVILPLRREDKLSLPKVGVQIASNLTVLSHAPSPQVVAGAPSKEREKEGDTSIGSALTCTWLWSLNPNLARAVNLEVETPRILLLKAERIGNRGVTEVDAETAGEDSEDPSIEDPTEETREEDGKGTVTRDEDPEEAAGEETGEVDLEADTKVIVVIFQGGIVNMTLDKVVVVPQMLQN